MTKRLITIALLLFWSSIAGAAGLHDMVKMTVSGTPGTGTITLGSAISGYQTFANAGVINGEVISYRLTDGSNWEVGRGTYTTVGTTLTRGPLYSSNSNSTISADSGTIVSIVLLGEDLSNGGVSPNTVNAQAYSGADMCAQISNAAAALYTLSPGGGTIDARGFTGAQSCASSMFVSWPVNTTVYFPVTILWGSQILNSAVPQPTPAPWVVITPSVSTNTQAAPFTSSQTGGSVAYASAYYVAPSPFGSDSNAGTFAAPFLTLGKCQTAMQSGNKTCYVRGGTYTLTTALSFSSSDNGEYWSGYPGDPPHSAIVVQNTGASNNAFNLNTGLNGIYFANFAFNANGGTGTGFFQGGSNSNVHIVNNVFYNGFSGSQNDIIMYNSGNMYIQGNVFGPNDYQPISIHETDAGSHTGLYITDNIAYGFSRYFTEIQNSGSTSGFNNAHVDRNQVLANLQSVLASFSIVGTYSATSSNCSTVWGNNINGTFVGQPWGFELNNNGSASLDVESNVINNAGASFFFSTMTGMLVQNNSAANWGNGYGNVMFNSEAGWASGQGYVGANISNGAAINGWASNTNSALPASCAPSAPFPVGTNTTPTITYLQNSVPYSSATVTTPVASPGVVDWTAHGLTGFTPVAFSGGTLPTGITANTIYYVIPSSIQTNSFEIATSIANAAANPPTAINFTGTSSGSQTGVSGAYLTTGSPADVTALSLPIGNWLVCAETFFKTTASTTTTNEQSGINTTAATLPSPPAGGYADTGTISIAAAGRVPSLATNCQLEQITTANTLVHLVAEATFGASTDYAYGVERAQLLH